MSSIVPCRVAESPTLAVAIRSSIAPPGTYFGHDIRFLINSEARTVFFLNSFKRYQGLRPSCSFQSLVQSQQQSKSLPHRVFRMQFRLFRWSFTKIQHLHPVLHTLRKRLCDIHYPRATAHLSRKSIQGNRYCSTKATRTYPNKKSRIDWMTIKAMW
jgi:hypothetical protein